MDLFLHSNSTALCKPILHGVSSGLGGRSNSLSLCVTSVCSKLVIAVFCTSVSGRVLSGGTQWGLHLNKQARPELPVLQGDTPALLLGAVSICQGCWPPAICAAPLLTHSCLPPWEMCHPGHWRAQSWQLLETEAAHLTPDHTTTVCTKEELAQCLHVTRSSVHFHHL